LKSPVLKNSPGHFLDVKYSYWEEPEMNAIKGLLLGPRGFCICLLGLALLLSAAGKAAASAADVGLVTKLSGEATYANKIDQKQPAAVQAFMKVRQGDHFRLPSGSQVQMVYFDNGRQETWTGPASFVAGAGESRVPEGETAGAPPEVKILPTKVSKKMADPNMPLPRSGLRYSGVIQTMAPECKTSTPTATCVKPLDAQGRKELKEAQKVYRSLRQQTEAGDLTPEFYLLSVLAAYGQYQQMLPVIDTMLTQKPGDPVLKDLKNWARSQPAPPGGPASK
jgi:hypothetical protein